MSTRRRPQTPKNPTPKSNRVHAEGYAEGMREIRKGSRAQPHTLAKHRKPKYPNRWEE